MYYTTIWDLWNNEPNKKLNYSLIPKFDKNNYVKNEYFNINDWDTDISNYSDSDSDNSSNSNYHTNSMSWFPKQKLTNKCEYITKHLQKCKKCNKHNHHKKKKHVDFLPNNIIFDDVFNFSIIWLIFILIYKLLKKQ